MRITLDWAGIKPFQDRKLDKALARAVKRAGNDSIRALRAATKKSIRERTRIRAGFLADKALPLTFPKGVRLDSLIWVMRVSGKPVPLGEYPVRQTKKGVSVEVVRGQRKLIKSAFLALRSTGRKGVFRRPGKSRYPMGHKLGLSVSDAMKDGRTATAAFTAAQSAFGRRLRYWLPVELGKVR